MREEGGEMEGGRERGGGTGIGGHIENDEKPSAVEDMEPESPIFCDQCRVPVVELEHQLW